MSLGKACRAKPDRTQPRSGPQEEREPEVSQRVARLTLEDGAEMPDRAGGENRAYACTRNPRFKAKPGGQTHCQPGERSRGEGPRRGLAA